MLTANLLARYIVTDVRVAVVEGEWYIANRVHGLLRICVIRVIDGINLRVQKARIAIGVKTLLHSITLMLMCADVYTSLTVCIFFSNLYVISFLKNHHVLACFVGKHK